MATKNLGRTALEAGRYEHYKHERDQQKRARRRAEREFLSKAKLDPDTYEDMAAPRELTLGKRGFQGENLGAVYRYLDSQVGRNWDTIYSEIRERFDTRSINGHHIVFDHMVGMVRTTNDPERRRWYRWYVDSQGRLQSSEKKSSEPKPKPVFFDQNRFYNFLGNRRLKREGDKLYWLLLDIPSEVRIGYDDEGEPIMEQVANICAVGGGSYDAYNQRGEFLKRYNGLGASKKGRKLTDQEVAYLNTVPDNAIKPYLEKYKIPEEKFPDPTKLYKKWNGSLVRIHHLDKDDGMVTYEVKGEGRYLKTSSQRFLLMFSKNINYWERWDEHS